MVKREFFARNYLACWKFFCESRWFMVFSLGIFALLFLIGFVFPIFFREEILGFIVKMIEMIEGKSVFELIGFIFLNNMKASFMAIVLGFVFGIFPLVTVVVNGYLLGFVAREVVMEEGLFVLWRLLPHGIFELPAVIFSIGIGMKIGMSVFGGRGSAKKRLKYNFREGLRFFIFVVFPLLLIAGIIEGVLIGMVS